jgi:hypothetical protein
MQTIAPSYTPAHAQHVPDGWGFPTLTPPQPPQPTVQPVAGGGASSTVTRLRWGRVLPVLAGIGLLAFGIWSANGPTAASDTRTVSGGGASNVEVAPSTPAEPAGLAEPAATPPVASDPQRTQSPRPAGQQGARPQAGQAGRVGAAAIAGTTDRSANAFATASAGAAGAAGAAGGGAPAGELPMTGIETWIAGMLGALLLGIGIAVQINAVRIAATAMLYRRGILLRPVDCARLAQEHGFSRARVLLSNALHRLLEEPEHGGDFVSARHAL